MRLGAANAPVLFVMLSHPGEATFAWIVETLNSYGVAQTDIQTLFLLEEEPENSGGRPSARQMKVAMPRLALEVEASTPRVVVPFGSDALYALTGLKEGFDGIADARGYLIGPDLRGSLVRSYTEQIGLYKTSNKKTGRQKGDPKMGTVKRVSPGLLSPDFKGWVIPAYDPYTLQKGWTLKPAMKADLKRVARALAGRLEIVDEGFTYHQDLETEEAWVDYPLGILAVDIETTGIDNMTIERVSLSDGTRTHTLPWTADVRAWVNRQVTRSHDWLLFHNGSFDVPRLKNAGIEITDEMADRCVYDTMWGSTASLPDLPKGLGRVAPFHLDLYPWKWDLLKNGDPVFYSAKDAYVTALLFKRGQQPFIKQMGMWPLVTGRDYPYGPGMMATIPVLEDMNRQGMRKDRAYANAYSEHLEDELLGYIKKWANLFPNVDPGSSKQLMDLLYGTWKLPIQRVKKQGITTNELALMKLQIHIQQPTSRGPWRDDERCQPGMFDLLLEIRSREKSISTYCAPILDSGDEYVHPSYMPYDPRGDKDADLEGSKGNTATGRLACAKPNLLNQSRGKPGAQWAVRKMFIPDRPDLCFVQFDVKLAEMFAMAASAGDGRMLDELKGDPYQAVADGVGITRSIGKAVVLAEQYLAGPPQMSNMILADQHIYVAPDTCKVIAEALRDRWRERTAYRWYLADQCKTKGWLRNPFGRVRVFPDRRATAAVNFIPQSIVADAFWCILLRLHRAGKALGGRLTTGVYDSALFQVPERMVDECVALVTPILQTRFDCVSPGFYFPRIDVEVGAPGASWGDLKAYAA
jgi:hypothetical protein